jgi:hypothetical protein
VLLRAPNLGWSDLRPTDLLDGVLPDGLAPVLGNEADLAARTVADLAPAAQASTATFSTCPGRSASEARRCSGAR